MHDRERASRHDQTAVRASCEGRKAALDLAGVDQVDRAHFDGNRWRYRLNCAPLADAGGDGGIANDRSARGAGCDLLEHLQPFRADAIVKLGKTGDVAARVAEIVNEACTDRIGYQTKDERHAACYH